MGYDRKHWLLALVATLLVSPLPALAQPADLPIPPATTSTYPPGVKVAKAATGQVYTDSKGQTLYGMDMRTLLRWSPDPALYCQAECARDWVPLLAPPGAKANVMFPRGFGERRAAPGTRPPPLPEGFVPAQTAPDWTIIVGPAGLQWVYKGWHMVFTRKGAKRGETAFDGAGDMTWNTLKHVPPVPQIVAPDQVAPLFSGSAYALADREGRVLYTGTCAKDCAAWTPLRGGMASRGIGEWTILSSGLSAGDAPQWQFRGQPVFVSPDDAGTVPAGATVLRP